MTTKFVAHLYYLTISIDQGSRCSLAGSSSSESIFLQGRKQDVDQEGSLIWKLAWGRSLFSMSSDTEHLLQSDISGRTQKCILVSTFLYWVMHSQICTVFLCEMLWSYDVSCHGKLLPSSVLGFDPPNFTHSFKSKSSFTSTESFFLPSPDNHYYFFFSHLLLILEPHTLPVWCSLMCLYLFIEKKILTK